jgi:RNA polymerase sigma-70 factor (ECF subfamily)
MHAPSAATGLATNAHSQNDEQLMLLCRGAPPDLARRLIGELAVRHLERLATFLFGITGDRSGSLDLAQEAFVRVFKHRDSYKEIARFSTWLYTIGRNLALNEIRNRKRRPNLVGGVGREEGRDVLAEVSDGGPGPAAAAQATDLRQIVREAIQQLPDHYRSVVILCDLEERPYAEAAVILEVPVGTIRSRLSRARSQLATLLRDVLDGA